ncbi:MAG TPA: ABC transporter [Clostridiales bacterium]|nr:ABC transporter [Clostridiales bacterium]HBW04978.1 ABC transporter [Clostridiales bacterium]HCH92836.1 ABC transporter [Clostridiales bacterium]
MKTFFALTKRNIKIFFKDKGMFFTSMITPAILLVLYVTFLAKVYRESFSSSLPEGLSIPEKLINGMVGAELISSLLAVCCVTVAFCSNLLMVNDKITGARKDFLISPAKKSTIAAAYFAGSLLTTLIVTYVATAACLVYVAVQGWYMSAGDVFLLLLDVFLITSFGTAFSSIVNSFLTTQGQASGVGTIVSAGYGFICGAYMPISSFGKGLQNFMSFLPGTYGTALIRNHALSGVFEEMSVQGFPSEVVEKIKDSVDCNLYFFDDKVSTGAMYGVLIGAIVVFVAVYVLINFLESKTHKSIDDLMRKNKRKNKKTNKNGI